MKKRKAFVLIPFILMVVSLSSCGTSKKLKDYDCGCWGYQQETPEIYDHARAQS